MSGIACILDFPEQLTQKEEIMSQLLSRMKHRGNEEPPYSIKHLPKAILGCNHFTLKGNSDNSRSLTNEQNEFLVVFDGRIFNQHELHQDLVAMGYQFRTNTEEELLSHCYHKWRDELVDHLDGMFAFVMYDPETDAFLAARDHIGIKPLYYLQHGETYLFASETKALLGLGQDIQILQPGHVLTQNGTRAYFQLTEQPLTYGQTHIMATVKELLTSAVRRQVQIDQPIGVMFSGGIDSTIILNIALQYHKNVVAFSTGFKGASDIETAQRYCQENNIQHYSAYLTIEELTQDLPQAVHYCETFEAINIMDTCTVSPAFKLAKEMGIQVMLCGDGSDELFAGYDLFKTYPDPHYLMKYRLGNEHKTDLQRIDRSSMRYTIEARVPFLDKAFLCYAYNIPMKMKLYNGIDKWILREAFKDDLPDYIFHRPKVRMPDGSGLHYQLLNYVREQKTAIDPLILAQLYIHPPDGAYFLEQYLKLGYAVPLERYKKPALDFSPHGYFDFIT